MIKSRFKVLIILFIIMLLSFSSICLASDADAIMPISETQDNTDKKETIANTRYSDLYVSNESQYNINNTIEGNVFAEVDTLNIELKNDYTITGNLYAIAKNVNIKSDIIYSENEKDEFGNKKIDSINSISAIYGNVFVTANKFVLEPGCEINGDLYICANEIELAQNSVIYGNVFAVSNNLIIDSQIGGDLYATSKNFDMKYYGFIRRDLHLNSDNATLNGYIYRNAFINSNNITINNQFITEQDLNIQNASNVTFSGEVKGNANINSKNIEFKNKTADEQAINCKIGGDLNYSSNKELQLENGIVFGNINYTKYESSLNLLSDIGDFFLGLLTTLAYVVVVYFIIKKFMPKYMEKVSNLNIQDILKSLGIGLGILILTPIISIILLITRVGSLIGLLILIAYILFLILAKPIFVISVALLISNKNSNSTDENKSNSLFDNIVKISLVTIVLSLINLIPYFGFVISLLATIIGIGFLIKSLL